MERMESLGKMKITYHNSYKLYKNKTIQYFITFFSFLIILNHSVYYYMENVDSIISNAIIVCTLLVFLVTTGAKINNDIKWPLVLCIGISLLYFAFGDIGGGVFSYVARYLYFVPLTISILSALNKYNKFSIFFTLSDIISTIAIISLFFWVFTSLFQVLPNMGFIETSWGGISGSGDTKGVINHFFVYFSAQKTYWNIGPIYRNCGIFCEGPAYAFVLALAIITETFLRDAKNKKRLVMLWATMITTLTTSAVLYFILVCAMKWYLSRKASKTLKNMILPLLLFALLIGIQYMLQFKLNQRSVLIRMSAYNNAFTAFVSKPLFGYGYKYDVASNFFTGITDSFSDALVRGGICFISIYLIPLIVGTFILFRKIQKKRAVNGTDFEKQFVILIFALYSFMTCTLTYTFIMLLLICYGYTIIGKEDRNGRYKKNNYNTSKIY